MPVSSVLGEVEEVRHLTGEVDPDDRRYEVDGVDAGQCGAVGGLVVPMKRTSALPRAAVRARSPRSLRFFATRDPVLPVPPSTSVVGWEFVMTQACKPDEA